MISPIELIPADDYPELYESMVDDNEYSGLTINFSAEDMIVWLTIPNDTNVRHSYRLSIDTSAPSAKFSRLLELKINNHKMPVRGDANLPSGYGHWQYNRDMLFLTDLPICLASFDPNMPSEDWNTNNFTQAVYSAPGSPADIVRMSDYDNFNSFLHIVQIMAMIDIQLQMILIILL